MYFVIILLFTSCASYIPELKPINGVIHQCNGVRLGNYYSLRYSRCQPIEVDVNRILIREDFASETSIWYEKDF